jgi:pyrimidine-nucleoside phosphorylase/thymidine phosphorylase
MRIVDLIHRKRDGEELSAEEIVYLVEGFARDEVPEPQMAAFLMAVFFRGMSDIEVGALTECMLRSGERTDLSSVPGVKVEKHSTGGVGDKTSLIAAPLAAAAGAIVPMISDRAYGYTGGTRDKLESIPGFRTELSVDEVRENLRDHGLCFVAQTAQTSPVENKLYALREATATVESTPLLASSIMAQKLASGLDALVLDVKVGSGAFMKKQIEARRLAQAMVAIGRRADKRVQALITDMNQPLGYAVGNALEVMEASQTLQNVGPTDLTRISLELAARMIYLGKVARNMEESREAAQQKLLDGSGYKKLKEVIKAQGGNPQVLDRFELLPNATGLREISSPRSGFVSAINAEDVGRAAAMIGAGRENKDDTVDPAVGVILEVKTGEKVEAGSVLCRIYYTHEERLDEAAQVLEDAFRISAHPPEERELILEVVG